jgi:hypothetical protein
VNKRLGGFFRRVVFALRVTDEVQNLGTGARRCVREGDKCDPVCAELRPWCARSSTPNDQYCAKKKVHELY